MEDGSIFEIADDIAVYVRGASTGELLKMYFENGGIMEEDGFVHLKPDTDETQKSFMSFFVLISERGDEGRSILKNLLEKYKEGRFDCKGRALKPN